MLGGGKCHTNNIDYTGGGGGGGVGRADLNIRNGRLESGRPVDKSVTTKDGSFFVQFDKTLFHSIR